jgi:hypothetical protein
LKFEKTSLLSQTPELDILCRIVGRFKLAGVPGSQRGRLLAESVTGGHDKKGERDAR